MTNNNDRIARLLAKLQDDTNHYSAPIMPTIVRRPPPKARRTSVRHRAIR